MKKFKCPKCGSFELTVRESMFTCLIHCKKCNYEWRP